MGGIGKDLEKAKKIINKGDVVAFPTETVYGLGASAINEDAIKKIFEIKQRPLNNPLIIHFSSIEKILPYTSSPPDIFYELSKKLWPGPFTFILKKNEKIPDIASAGLDTIGVRIPDHKLALDFLDQFSFPIAAPSANPFKYISPTSSTHVLNKMKNKIPYILDGGCSKYGLESTIVKYDEIKNILIILRPGSITKEQIKKSLTDTKFEDIKIEFNSTSKKIESSGMLKKHYSPNKKLIVTKDIKKEVDKYFNNEILPKICTISFYDDFKHPLVKHNIILSKKKNIFEASQNLYSSLIEADELDIDLIIAPYFENIGLGHTINDRLIKASSKTDY